MIYEAYVLYDNPRKSLNIHRSIKRIGTWLDSNGESDISLEDFIKSLKTYNGCRLVSNTNIIVYATNKVKLLLNNDEEDHTVVVEYRHPVYVGTIDGYRKDNTLIHEIHRVQII